MSQLKPKPGIVVVSRNPHLAKMRKKLLESAGFEVIPATNVREATAACEKQSIRMAMIGYSLYPAEKRRIANAIKQSCNVPVLQLQREEGPEVVQPTYFHHPHTPDDFIDAVTEILRKSR